MMARIRQCLFLIAYLLTHATLTLALGQDWNNTANPTWDETHFAEAPVTTSSASSPLITTPSLRATYKGRFQLLVDGCESSPPVLQAACGGDIIRLVNVSHPAIVCTPSSPQNLPQGFASGLTCSIDCSIGAQDCQSEGIYRNDGSYTPSEGPWGEILYQCDGTSKPKIDSVFSYLDLNKGNATCDWRWFFDNQVYRMIQLGLLCDLDALSYDQVSLLQQEEILDTNTNNTTTIQYTIPQHTQFLYTAHFFECSEGTSMDLWDRPYFSAVLCADGQNCGGEDCQVEFDTPLQVHTDMDRVRGRCIEYLGDGWFQTEQVEPSMPKGEYTVQFQMGMSLLMKHPNFWYNVQDLECVLYEHMEVEINCTNGNINLLEVSDLKSFYCYTEESSLLKCLVPISGELMFGDEGFLNSFYTVNYECVATDQLPTTEVTTRRNTMSCIEDIYDELVVGPALQLGHFCKSSLIQDETAVMSAQEESTNEGYYDFGDYHYECGLREEFSLLDEQTNHPGDRLTCFDVIPLQYKNFLARIPRATMRSDWRLGDGEGLDPLCYDYQAAPSGVEEEDPTINESKAP